MKFMKDAIILFVITLAAGISLGAVNEVTKGPIAQAKIEAQKEAYRAVYPDAADFKANPDFTEQVEASKTLLADSGLSLGNVSVDDALEAVDGSDNVIGYIVNATSNDGYGGAVQISVGITKEGALTGIEFLEIAETPGLGMNATNPEFKDQFKGKAAESLTVSKSGASADNEISAISGATITSNAVTNAVNAALFFVQNCIAQ